MADGIQGLFTTPEQYQIMQQQAAQQRALGFAQMNPLERIDYGAYMAGNQLADAAARGLGGQDKQLALISRRQALSKQIDPSKPASIVAAAREAARDGDQEFAMTLANLARKAESEIALTEQRRMEKKAPAIQIADYRAELQSELENFKKMDQTDPMVIARIAGVQSRLDGLPVDKGPTISYGTEAQREAKGKYGKSYAELTPAEAVIVNAAVNESEITKAKAGATPGQQNEPKFREAMAKVDADAVKDLRVTSRNARSALQSLAQLTRLDETQLISGAFSSGRVGAANILNTLGLISADDKTTLAKSEQYQKVAGDVVLQMLGGKLGAGFSNADREFIISLVPQLENSPAARKQLIAFMSKKYTEIAEDAEDAEKYAQDKGGLQGWKSKLGATPSSAAAPDAAAKAARLVELKKLRAEKIRKETIARDQEAAARGGQ
jgi:hypothetical protein